MNNNVRKQYDEDPDSVDFKPPPKKPCPWRYRKLLCGLFTMALATSLILGILLAPKKVSEPLDETL